jgi:branched-chain amino acid transport system substrate-binding protein
MAKQKQVFLTIFVVTAFLISMLGTGFSQVSPTAPKEIVLGAALPLTGGQSREGGYFNKAYAMAVKEINDAGGIMIKAYGKKIPIKLIIYDDKSDNTTSVQLYEKLVTEDKVNALLGGYGTPLITAHTIVAEKYRVPYVNGGGQQGHLPAWDEYVFCIISSIENCRSRLWMDSHPAKCGKVKKPLRIALWERIPPMAKNSVRGP